MSNVRQYLPDYFDPIHIEREEAHATTREELEAISWIGSWKDKPNFFRFSFSAPNLMAETEGGNHWFVVAKLTEPELYGLPTWTPPNERD